MWKNWKIYIYLKTYFLKFYLHYFFYFRTLSIDCDEAQQTIVDQMNGKGINIFTKEESILTLLYKIFKPEVILVKIIKEWWDYENTLSHKYENVDMLNEIRYRIQSIWFDLYQKLTYVIRVLRCQYDVILYFIFTIVISCSRYV